MRFSFTRSIVIYEFLINSQKSFISSFLSSKYKTSDRVILENDIITIDLSPQRENIWGDYARTLIIENGIVVDDEFASNEEWKNGVHMEKQLLN